MRVGFVRSIVTGFVARRLRRRPRAVRLAHAVLGAHQSVAFVARVDGLVAEEAAGNDHRAPVRIGQLVVALAICIVNQSR